MEKDLLLATDNITLAEATQILQKYDDTEFSEIPYKACGVPVSTDFTGQRIKNGEYVNCNFSANSFKYSGASGTRFLDCKLISCNIEGANMQFCDFSNSTFMDNIENTYPIQGSNFNQSCFYKSTFQNVCIKNTSICQSQFLGTHITDSHFHHVTLQDNIFRDANIENSTFIGCNMEYSDFINVKIIDSILPFHQISYIYGGLETLNASGNTVRVKSSTKNAPTLFADEYINLLPVFIKYYEKEHEYFPLANITLFQEKYDIAKTYIKCGLREYIQKREFRKIKSLCKLAVKNDYYNRNDLLDFYFDILYYFNSIELSPNEQYQFGLHIDDIRNILFGLSYSDKSHVELILKTNVSINDSDELMNLIYIIEDCLRYYNIADEDYSLELKHNSPPYTLWLLISSIDPNVLVMAIGMICSVLSGNTDIICQALSACADLTAITGFIINLRQHRINNKLTENTHNHSETKETVYAMEKHKLLKSKTDVKFSVGNVRFIYQKEKFYQ